MKTNFITELKKTKGILILGHRGCRKSDVFENTIPAFQKAFDAGADGIEIDVETTSDNRLVVANRWFLNKNFGFFPYERNLDTIQAYGKEKGISVPTFDEVCEFIKTFPESVFNVEVKSCDRFLCRTAKQVGHSIYRFGIERQVIVSSFDMNALVTMKFYYPGIESAYLFRMEDRVTELKEKGTAKYRLNGFINRSGIKAVLTGVSTLHPEIKLINENKQSPWQQYAKLTGKRINCWTVDTKADFRKAVNIGADIVISDNPEKTVGYRFKLKNIIQALDL